MLNELEEIALVQILKRVKGAVSYDGDASVQVLLPTEGGQYIRIGVTDEDVAAKPGLWFEYPAEIFERHIQNNKDKKVGAKIVGSPSGEP